MHAYPSSQQLPLGTTMHGMWGRCVRYVRYNPQTGGQPQTMPGTTAPNPPRLGSFSRVGGWVGRKTGNPALALKQQTKQHQRPQQPLKGTAGALFQSSTPSGDSASRLSPFPQTDDQRERSLLRSTHDRNPLTAVSPPFPLKTPQPSDPPAETAVAELCADAERASWRQRLKCTSYAEMQVRGPHERTSPRRIGSLLHRRRAPNGSVCAA